MSILDDNLFAENRKRLQELLQEIFLSEYNNVKYIKAKSKRSLLAIVADNLQKNIEKDLKVTNSDFKPPKAKTEVKSEPQGETTQADLYGDPLTQVDNELRF